MNKTKIAAFATAGVGVLALVVVAPLTVGAQEDNGSEGDSFISALAEKLELSEDTVQTAVAEVREERKAEHQAEAEAAIQGALSNGEITDEQAEIMTALIDLDFERPSDEDRLSREEMQALSDEEREALIDEHKAERQQAVIDALSEQGVSVTSDQLEEIHQLTMDLNIRGGKCPGGRGGHGHGPREGF